MKANNEAIEVILAAIEKAGFKAGSRSGCGYCPRPRRFRAYEEDTKTYNLRKEGKKLTGEQMVEFWRKWVTDYPIVSIEDGLAQDDWASWQLMVQPVREQASDRW